ncbi:MAG: outer membrane lipid asymmetry maintenance protein MlaD [Desulfovibrionaceae bacterium]|nr:outer membrane lipid asymmetry maintenance protein MlaD [Desulfovibrionaceae bacterium]
MKKYSIETAVGVFVLAGLLCVAYLTVKLGKMEIFGGDTYTVYARFNDVTGLGNGAFVEMAGVRVGKVSSIGLHPEDNTAVVELRIQNDVRLTDDAIASIKTSGLIGDKYVKISPGGSGVMVNPGGMLLETESSVDLTDLIGKYVFGGVK